MTTMLCEVVVKCFCLLGESPVWDALNQRILWIDIDQKQIHEFYTVTGQHQIIQLNKTPGSIFLAPNGNVTAAVENGFALVDLKTGALAMLAEVELENIDNRFNDGKCDSSGRFWAGTMSISGKRNAGHVYALEKSGSVSLKIPNVSISNGIVWSLDNSILYYIDTPTQQVIAYAFDIKSGNITNKRVVITIPEEMGAPDGMTIDSEGMLWIALWGGGAITRWNPQTGEHIYRILLPASKITSMCFGGNNLADIFVTSASVGLSDAERLLQPAAGSLFKIKNSGFSGIAPPELV